MSQATQLIGKRTTRERAKPQSPRYYYSIWLRHLKTAHAHGLSTNLDTVVELGPGDCLGMIVAALLSGVRKAYVLDVMPFADVDASLAVVDELVTMFESRMPIPDASEFPKVRPSLPDYSFPANILTPERLEAALRPQRVDEIRRAIRSIGNGQAADAALAYIVPWRADSVPLASADAVLSQAVLEYLDDVENTYRTMFAWLKPGGWMSHAIDFKSHGTARDWDGHWRFSRLRWWWANRNRPYRLNRYPHSWHVKAIETAGFLCRCDLTTTNTPTCKGRYAKEFRGLSEEDRSISGAFIQAAKDSPRSEGPRPEKTN